MAHAVSGKIVRGHAGSSSLVRLVCGGRGMLVSMVAGVLVIVGVRVVFAVVVVQVVLVVSGDVGGVGVSDSSGVEVVAASKVV